MRPQPLVTIFENLVPSMDVAAIDNNKVMHLRDRILSHNEQQQKFLIGRIIQIVSHNFHLQ